MADGDGGRETEGLKETRIALAFFGGVSLAIYESGVAMEMCRLVQETSGVYRDLKKRLRSSVVVDIITGTSAGALSGAFLANALVNGGDLSSLARLWFREGDFGSLQHRRLKRAKSLLNGDKFLNLVRDALVDMQTGEVAQRRPQEFVDLFITATSLTGDRISVSVADEDEKIATRSHRRLFRFRFRGNEHNPGEQSVNDFATPQHLRRLALAVRASASFPFAFEPVLITPSEFGDLTQHLQGDAYHIDGGILDNKPIIPALNAIMARRADNDVERHLFYVEPMPDSMSASSSESRKFTPWEVLYAAIKGIPSHQSITNALVEIRTRNNEVEELRRTLSYYERLAAHSTTNGNKLAVSLAWSWRRWKLGRPTVGSDLDGIYEPPNDVPRRLFRAQEDGYLDLRMRREFPNIFDEIHRIRSHIDEKLLGKAKEKAKQMLYHLTNRILFPLDLRYHQRLYRYLLQLTRRLQTQLSEAENAIGLEEGVWLRERLNRIRHAINEQREQLARIQDDQSPRSKYESQVVLASLRDMREKLLSGLPGSCNIANWLFGLKIHISHCDFAVQQVRLLAAQRSFMRRIITRVQKEVQNCPLRANASRDVRVLFNIYYESCLSTLGQFHQRDMLIYPLMGPDDVIDDELQRIRVRRISPDKANSYIPHLSAAQKLAGEPFMNFGGFMRKEWRANDLTWGRLDAAEIIIKCLMPNEDRSGMVEMIQRAQREIVRDMKCRGMGICEPLARQSDDGSPPPMECLIGTQGLGKVPWFKRVTWILGGTLCTFEMLPRLWKLCLFLPFGAAVLIIGALAIILLLLWLLLQILILPLQLWRQVTTAVRLVQKHASN